MKAASPATLQRTLRVLRARRVDARDRFGVDFVGVVGSLARGEARADSDVDVIVRQVGKTTLFTLSRLEEDLGSKLGRPVELVFSEMMGSERRAYIERDLIPL